MSTARGPKPYTLIRKKIKKKLKKKIEEDIFFNFKNFIESLYYFKDIVELDVVEIVIMRRKSQWLVKRSKRLRILFRFVQDPDI